MNERDFTAILSQNCKRKEARKTKKKLKVACRVAFSQHKKVFFLILIIFLINIKFETAISEKFSKKISKKEKRKLKRQRKKERKENGAEESDGNFSDLEKFKKEVIFKSFIFDRKIQTEAVRMKLIQGKLVDDEMDIKIYEKKLGLINENNGNKKKIM